MKHFRPALPFVRSTSSPRPMPPPLCRWVLAAVVVATAWAAGPIVAPAAAQTGLAPPPASMGDDLRNRPDAGDLLREEGRPPLELPAPPSPGERDGIPSVRFFLRAVEVAGVTAFPPKEIQKVVAPYEGREVTSDDLESLRRSLTLLYVNHGYINSGAVIPDQDVADGVVGLQVVEGELTSIDVLNNETFRASYFERRIRRFTSAPLNLVELQNGLLRLQRDPRIVKLDANLRPAARPGQSTLDLTVLEVSPYWVSVLFDNYESPSVGALHGQITAQHRSLTGNGDVLSVGYGRTEGLNPQIDAWYSLPINAQDTMLTVRYRKNESSQVEAPFDDLDIESRSDVYLISLRHPFYRGVENELEFALTGEYRHDETYLLGERFSFSEGTRDGESTLSVLRFAPEWVHRSRTRVVAASSRFSLGTKALGATHNDGDTPDGQFLAWLMQLQWAEVLGPAGLQSIARADLQLASDRLLPAEQIVIGGRYSVRGYRQNLFVRDNAFIASLELRFPLVQGEPWADVLQLASFFDYGTGWNTGTDQPPDRTIYSIGAGLRWAATLGGGPHAFRPHAEFYWGHALKDVDQGTGDDLQDDGIYFQVGLEAF